MKAPIREEPWVEAAFGGPLNPARAHGMVRAGVRLGGTDGTTKWPGFPIPTRTPRPLRRHEVDDSDVSDLRIARHSTDLAFETLRQAVRRIFDEKAHAPTPEWVSRGTCISRQSQRQTGRCLRN